MKHTIIVFLSVGIVIALLLFLKYYFYENKSNNTTQLIKGPNTPPNDEYYPIIVGEETGSQNLYTNKSKFNYDVVNNILYIDNLQGNLKNKSAFVSNLIKESASNNLLVQRSNNTTSLISPGKVGNVLVSNGSNNVPSWKGIYDDTPGFNSILFRPIKQSYYPLGSPIHSIASPSTDSNITFSSISSPDDPPYDIVVKNLTINGILSLNGVRINVSDTLTINGTIRHDRGSIPYNTLGVPIVTNSSVDSLNGNPTNSEAGFGGNGAGENSIGGSNIYPSNKEGGRKLFYQYPNFLRMGYYDINNNFITYKGGASGGRGNNINYLGGSGGTGGGVIHICAKNIVFGPNGKIEAVGGNGGDCQTDNTGTPRGGGGGGGGGGLIVIVTDTKNLSPTDTTKFNVSGGNAGLGGNAQKGGDGKVIIFDYL